MLKNMWLRTVLSAFIAGIVIGCNTGEQNTSAPAAVAPVAPTPVQPQPVAEAPAAPTPAAPPATPLVPVGNEPAATTGKVASSGRGAKDAIDKPLPGQKTSGDELVGNYSCKVDAKGLPIGPFKLPAFGCRIFKSGDDGSLKVGPTSQGATSLKGNVQDSTAAGFFIIGQYSFPGNKLGIKARMKLKPGGQVVYNGNGRGNLNDDKSNTIKYTLNMTKK